MKILLKEKIRGIISSFQQANDYFETVPVRSNALGVCITCQETAQKLGEIIEQNEQNPKTVTACLVNYCELIYQLYTADEQYWKDILQRLKEQVERLKKSVEDLTEEKMKVVFLPYNASMWDTFESICNCAKQDSRFMVSVIPVPYYSLGKNREILQEHYEGKQIAAFTEITDYRQYDLKSEKPDVVFIHNPYDQYNRVTQIHRGFYSSELVKYTSRLVYIPYYISKGKTLENMLEMPGVRNAWRIFVDSETVRQQYIDSGIDEAKVVASGSPKFDAVFQAMKEYTDLPDNWDILKGKRVIFYNTHLNGIINAGNEFIQNIHFIFSVFKRRKDIALLWRPHPLSFETIKAMNPGILADYRELVEDIKAGSYGVYDDTAELERTIAISDGYIGEDLSSVSRLYEATGKPIYYVESYNSILMQKERYARCLCAECCSGMVYMYSCDYNYIFIINEKDGRIKWEKGNEAYSKYEKNLYTHSVLDGNNVYFIPLKASSILKYNTETGEKRNIETGTESMDFYCIVCDRKLYLMPVYYDDSFLVLNLDTDDIECISMELPMGKGEVGNVPLFYGGVEARGCIWRACQIGPYVQKYNIYKNRFKYIKIQGVEYGIRSMVYDGTYFWLISYKGNIIYKWDSDRNKIVKTIMIEQWAHLKSEMLFADLQYNKNTLWIFLRNLHCIVKIDVITEEVRILDYSSYVIKNYANDKIQMFSENARLDENNVYLFPYHGNGIVKINLETEEIIYSETKLNQIDFLGSIEGNILNEKMCNLETFFDWKQIRSFNDKMIDIRTSGKEIWNHVIKEL